MCKIIIYLHKIKLNKQTFKKDLKQSHESYLQ